MKVKDAEAQYAIAPQMRRLIGEVVGSSALGDRVLDSIVYSGERLSERNLQQRLREAIASGNLRVKGLGPARLKRLQSALALGQLLYSDVPETGTVVDDPSIAAKACHLIAWASVEKFAVLVLNVKHRLISTRVISFGTATETIAQPRDIFGAVIHAGGTRCIVAHNHPSGSLEPSAEDIALTQQLLAAAKVLGIPMLDHLVVSGKRWESIRQNTCLWSDAAV